MNFLPFFIKPVKVGQEVDLKVVELAGYPKNSNPFHHDHFRMGSEVTKELMAMMSTGLKGEITSDLQLVNVPSGQRWALVQVPRVPEYLEVINLSAHENDGDLEDWFGLDVTVSKDGQGRYRPSQETNSMEVTPVGRFKRPIYTMHGKVAVLKSFLESSTRQPVIEKVKEVSFASHKEAREMLGIPDEFKDPT